jgi:hypothetical protein
MDFDQLVAIIKAVAVEQGYEITDGERKFEVYIDRYNAVAFEVWANSTSGYIQVHQWEGGNSVTTGKYGRAVYSLRNFSDVIHFCSVMMSSAAIRAGKK